MSPRKRAPAGRRVGVDTGGTFTDFVALEADGTLRIEKTASTPGDPGLAIGAGLERLGGAGASTQVVHGTTIALNALLTGRVARVALVTNEGFRDLIELGRQDRPELYAWHPVTPAPLVPRELRFEVGARIWPSPAPGPRAWETVAEPRRGELEALARKLRRAAPESIAVCLLHSYADPRHEDAVAGALAGLGAPITTSSGVLREYREFERFSTAVVNAALVPLMRDYLAGLGARVAPAELSLLQSSGGTLPAARAAEQPVRVVLSGPAGGVVGARRAAREAGFARMVGLDMGGTSTDVCFQGERPEDAVRGEPVRVAGHPIAVPSLDIHTIGCGGGSLLRVDAGGVLHVGPESAGADPGPVCYGTSDEPTVTDAHVLLGHVAPGAFLGGRLELDTGGVRRAFERLAKRLGTSPERAAQGALDVGRAAMRRAAGVMTMQRGEDPEALPLVAFGGAGGLHAAALAESLRMPCALVPFAPGVLSALGMATADASAERSETVLEALDAVRAGDLRATLRALASGAREELLAGGAERGAIEIEAALDLRYVGQSFEIRVAFDPKRVADASAAFHARHAERYGYALEDRPVELVNVRALAVARRPRIEPVKPRSRAMPKSAVVGERRAYFADAGGAPRAVKAPVVDRARLAPGHRFEGPALVEEFSGTTLVPPGWRARVTAGAHLSIERG